MLSEMNTNINYEKKAEALRERTREGAREEEGRGGRVEKQSRQIRFTNSEYYRGI